MHVSTRAFFFVPRIVASATLLLQYGLMIPCKILQSLQNAGGSATSARGHTDHDSAKPDIDRPATLAFLQYS